MEKKNISSFMQYTIYSNFIVNYNILILIEPSLTTTRAKESVASLHICQWPWPLTPDLQNQKESSPHDLIIVNHLCKPRFWSVSLLSPFVDLGRFLNTQLFCVWHRPHWIFRYCMVYKWSLLCHMPILCSVDIYTRIITSLVTHYLLMWWGHNSRKITKCLKTCLNLPRGRGRQRTKTLSSKDDS